MIYQKSSNNYTLKKQTIKEPSLYFTIKKQIAKLKQDYTINKNPKKQVRTKPCQRPKVRLLTQAKIVGYPQPSWSSNKKRRILHNQTHEEAQNKKSSISQRRNTKRTNALSI